MNNADLNNEVLLNLNSLVVDNTVGRLIGYSETSEDFYYIIHIFHEGNVKKNYQSCVGSLTFVKDSMCSNEYKELDLEYEKILPKVETMVVENHTQKRIVYNI